MAAKTSASRSLWISVLLLLLMRTAESKDNDYITWDDLSVGEQGARLRNAKGKKVIVVDQNGRGDSRTVQGAVDMVPDYYQHRVLIHIRPGVYSEKVVIPNTKPYVSFIGEDGQASNTVITWHDKASDSDGHGGTLGTVNTPTVAVLSDYFCAAHVTFENPVVEPMGKGGFQGVAFRISGERAMLYRARFLGSQDTLWDDRGSHYFYQCFIQGSVDFICGNAKSLYQECAISTVNHGYAIAAHARSSAAEDTGFSFVNCTVRGVGPAYLGRAWGDYALTIYSYCNLELEVRAEGWDDWGNHSRDGKAMLGEYECRGRGADRSGRVWWSRALNFYEAKPYLTTDYIQANQWLRLH